jgi:hypothetical protein
MFAVGLNDDELYGLSPDGSGVFKWTGQGEDWTKIGGPASAIFYGGLLLATNPETGDIWRWDGTPMAWTRIGGPAKMFSVDYGCIYAISPDGSGVFMYGSHGTSGWIQIGGPADFIAANVDDVFTINPDTKDVWTNDNVCLP